MEHGKRVLAFDLGASSGRAMLGSFDGERISYTEIHRFSNDPVQVHGTLYWDILRLFHEIRQGIRKAQNAGGFDSIGIDTWGVDFGLIDDENRLVENPVHYRDRRTEGIMEECFGILPRREFYAKTGIQFMEINTVFQLCAVKKKRPHVLDKAKTLLLTGDLLNFMLTGEKHTECSIASTTQLLNARDGSWSHDILRAFGLPAQMFTDIVQPGYTAGIVCDEIRAEYSLPRIPVICTASHDTQSAVAAIPAASDDFIFISCGTWSLIGTETEEPIISDLSYEYNLTNEIGCGGKRTFMKNIIGLWLLQETRRQWIREGREYDFAQLEQMARNSAAFRCFIDPDAPEFTPPGDIPKRIREYAMRTGQCVPETEEEIIRCIYESLALSYSRALEQISACTGKKYTTIHLAGGGSRDRLLCEMTANSCLLPVVAGPVEATVLGNVSVQLTALGEIRDMREARRIVSLSGTDSREIRTYEPISGGAWESARERFIPLVTAR